MFAYPHLYSMHLVHHGIIILYLCPLLSIHVCSGADDDDALEVALGLGDLAGLTINNEAEMLSYDVSL